MMLWAKTDMDESGFLNMQEFIRSQRHIISTKNRENYFGIDEDTKQLEHYDNHNIQTRVNDIVDGIFAETDIDGDGRISKQEFMTVHADTTDSQTTWKAGDHNSDNIVDREELAMTVQTELMTKEGAQ